MPTDYILSADGELYHYGVKGMKWGVRRYQNKDGTLTAAAKARAMSDPKFSGKLTRDAYRKVGASKQLANRYGDYAARDLKDVKKAEAAIDRLRENKYTKKEYKQLAKDYSTAINSLKRMDARKRQERYVDQEQIDDVDRALRKLNGKKPSDRTAKKIAQLTSDSELMQLNVSDLDDVIASRRFKAAADSLIDSMSRDKRVVYNTKERSLAATRLNGNTYYDTWGAKYNVKANTKSRSKRKAYTEPERKRQYTDHDRRVTEQYYVY